MSILIVAVNDELAKLEDLKRAVESRHDGVVVSGPAEWADIAQPSAECPVIVLCRTFWQSTASFVDRMSPLRFSRALLLLDSSVETEDEGEEWLAGLLGQSDQLPAKWWAAIMSEANPTEKIANLHSLVSDLEAGVTSTHFVGASQHWLDDGARLIAQVLAGDTPPRLGAALVDRLKSTMHRLANLALPIQIDIQALDEIADPTARAARAELLSSEYFSAQDAYLKEGSNYHRYGGEQIGADVTTLLAAERAALQDACYATNKQEIVDVFTTLRAVMSKAGAGGTEDPVAALRMVVDAIAGAVASLRSMAATRRE